MAVDESCCSDKERTRLWIWQEMERLELVPYPLPLKGRIPNFHGSKSAAYKLCSTPEFRSARTVKIHPSLNATSLRYLALKFGKVVLTPPLPGHTFLYFLLDPTSIPPTSYKFAATKRGFNKLGTPCASLDSIPKADLVVVATVACTQTGARVGKGKGYGEVEYGILREIGAVNIDTPVATLVHDVQVVDSEMLPIESLNCYDVPVDLVCTPSRIIRTKTRASKPRGIFWELISEQMMRDIGALGELKKRNRVKNDLPDT